MAPASRRRRTMVASLPGRRPASIRVPFSVGMSAVSMMSFNPTVRPCRAPIGRPLARYSSPALAAARGMAGSKNAKASMSGSLAASRRSCASTYSAARISPRAIRPRASNALKSAGSVAAMPPSARIEQVGEVINDLREDVDQHHGDQHQQQERDRTAENLHQLHERRRDSLQVVGRHGHRRRQERRLQIERDQDAEEQRIDPEMRQQRQEDRDEDNDDLGPFQRPSQQEDDELAEQQELERGNVEPGDEFGDHLFAAEVSEYRREGRGADEQPTHHGGGA